MFDQAGVHSLCTTTRCIPVVFTKNTHKLTHTLYIHTYIRDRLCGENNRNKLDLWQQINAQTQTQANKPANQQAVSWLGEWYVHVCMYVCMFVRWCTNKQTNKQTEGGTYSAHVVCNVMYIVCIIVSCKRMWQFGNIHGNIQSLPACVCATDLTRSVQSRHEKLTYIHVHVNDGRSNYMYM